MQFETSRFGALDLEERTFITFPWGIPGFEQLKRYVLLEHRQGPFYWLQAVDDPSVAFLVCEPEVMGATVRIPLEKGIPIEIEQPEDLTVLIMVSFDQEHKKLHPHWRGPLLFNSARRLAYQVSLDPGELEKYMQMKPD